MHGLLARPRYGYGRLFVLTDVDTYSAAVCCAARLERETLAVFVGEATGAGPNHCGDAERTVLPGTGAELWISTLHWQVSDPRDRRCRMWPDVEAPLTFADWRAGRDPALEAALSWSSPGGRDPRPNRNWFRPSQRR